MTSFDPFSRLANSQQDEATAAVGIRRGIVRGMWPDLSDEAVGLMAYALAAHVADASKFMDDVWQIWGPAADFQRLRQVHQLVEGMVLNRTYLGGAADPDELADWPAMELISTNGSIPVQTWQPQWTAAGGQIRDGRMVALRWDPVWAQISWTGLPWPPFGLSMSMDWAEVSREDAERLGVIGPGDPVQLPRLPDCLEGEIAQRVRGWVEPGARG